MRIESQQQFRTARLTSALEVMCEKLELTETQRELAKTRYEGVGSWLADGAHPALKGLIIYLQGSTALGTTVKPIGSNEHDVDLIARMTIAASAYQPAQIKKVVGDRLREHGTYERLLEEMCRCWRLGYAGEFHLDVTPSIPNTGCDNGGELVPDKELRTWKASNPRGYKEQFDRRAALMPRLRLAKSISLDEARAGTVEPYPEEGGFKGILRRIVQISKRHRDVYFDRRKDECAPISIIITTLLARAYEWCVTHGEYDNEYDLLVDVIDHMPDTIQRVGERWYIWNETTAGENFAEKWNDHPDRCVSFYSWHRRLSADMRTLRDAEGMDRLAKSLDESLGSSSAGIIMEHFEKSISGPRSSGALRYGAGGLAAGAASRATAAVPKNTFFGR